MTQKLLAGLLILGSIFLAAMDYPEHGNDYSSYRCLGGLVSIGDTVSDVVDQCSEPMKETSIDGQPYRFFVYRFDQIRFVYYFVFLGDRLERILAVSCQYDDPNCE